MTLNGSKSVTTHKSWIKYTVKHVRILTLNKTMFLHKGNIKKLIKYRKSECLKSVNCFGILKKWNPEP